MLKILCLIFLGGGAGSVLRFLIQTGIHKWINTYFPLGILLVNIFGSFLIGLAIGLTAGNQQHFMRFLFIVGFCGGFTTFSSFSLDSIILLKESHYFMFSLNIFLNIFLCLSATMLGLFMTKS